MTTKEYKRVMKELEYLNNSVDDQFAYRQVDNILKNAVTDFEPVVGEYYLFFDDEGDYKDFVIAKLKSFEVKEDKPTNYTPEGSYESWPNIMQVSSIKYIDVREYKEINKWM